MSITVKTLSKTYRLNVDLADTGESLKRSLPEEVVQLLETDHCLLIGSAPLDMDIPLAASGVTSYSTLYLVRRDHTSHTMSVSVVYENTQLKLETPTDATVKRFKELCMRSFGLVDCQVKVVSRGQEMSDTARVSDFYSESPIHLALVEQVTSAAAGEIRVSVKPLVGPVVSLSVTPDMDCAQVKDLLTEYIDLPAARMRLIFAGKELCEGHFVREYYVVEGCVINLVPRMG